MKSSVLLSRGVGFALATLTFGSLPAAEPVGQPTFTAADYTARVEPALKQYCLGCHSIEKHKGDLDLESVNRWAEVQKHPKIWQGVAEQLANGEMPPKDKPQPTASEREALLASVNAMLDEVARSRAGDPGPVVLRRLSNAEYTYTVRDLTGVASLDPAREFPVDGAAGEGFMNTGNALVMSPALVTKYLDAGKDIASHAVLLPDGIRFSSKSTRRDWTEEILGEIRSFYREFTDPHGGDTVNLQGIVFQTNEGGRLPLERYLVATLELKASHASPTDQAAISAVARRHGLSPKYLAQLLGNLTTPTPSALLDPIRTQWRTASAADVPAIAADIGRWQKALWRFTSVGHIGKAGGPSAWMEPVVPLAPRQDFRVKLTTPTNGSLERAVYFVAGDAGDGHEHDVVLWKNPRLVAPGRPEIPLRDLPQIGAELERRRARVFAATDRALAAAAEAEASENGFNTETLARKHGVDPFVLRSWFDGLGLHTNTAVRVDSLFTRRVTRVAGFEFVEGWGNPETPNVFANRSDQAVRIPGNLKGHGVVLHPSPTLQAAVGWRSPISGSLRIEARVTHAHPECGNGVTWVLEWQHASLRQRLASGTAQGPKEVRANPSEPVNVRPGDLISLRIGPRDGNHSCDLTSVELILRETKDGGREWNLTREVSADGIAANPHSDALGNPGVWLFYTEPDKGGAEADPIAPAGSLLARWRSSHQPKERAQLAGQLRSLLQGKTTPTPGSPDATLIRQLSLPSGPLLRGALAAAVAEAASKKPARPLRQSGARTEPSSPSVPTALTAAHFGHLPDGTAVDPLDLVAQAPAVLEIRIPTALAAGYELITTGTLAPGVGAEGSVQLQVLERDATRANSNGGRGDLPTGLVAGAAKVVAAAGPWTTSAREVASENPVVVQDGSAARRRMETAMAQFRDLFPAALCYTKIVPVDEVVTLTLFYREDHHLARLMLDEPQRQRLDRLWSELHFVSQDALTLVDAYEQLWQFATQDADPKVFEPLREPIQRRAAEFRKALADTQPRHVEAVVEFAERAYRRPLQDSEKSDLRDLIQRLRREDLSHEDSIRLALARVLVSPAFLYRAETPVAGTESGPVSAWELANRLSYFLWSSAPDPELKEAARNGTLTQPDVLAAQARRMMKAPQVRRLATEFGCAWLHIYGFDQSSEKSERHFPTFNALKGAMYEESIRFLTDLFQSDRPVLDLIRADYTFLNGPLAAHYGIPGVSGDAWRRVDGVRAQSRGGILTQGATLASQSGASRTSPILRGNWLTEVLLGDKLPKPPKDVPRLPEDEATESLSVRQLTEKHSTDPRCAGCHRRIDAFGFSMEAFDAIGRRRDVDLAGHKLDTRVRVLDGAEFEGVEGLRDYLLNRRGDAFLRQFCRKLLGYSLGRSVQLSDGPLIQAMRESLKRQDYHVGAAVETLVRSRQFREIRGAQHATEE